jgi:predicted mannosyl-3-phosphoglycerate phosphatase (HAD superfamily)
MFPERNQGKKAEAIENKPKYDIGTQWYLDVFRRLSRSRSIGFSIGCIPLMEITNYALSIGYIEESLEDFIDIIQSMDDLYLTEVNKKNK